MTSTSTDEMDSRNPPIMQESSIPTTPKNDKSSPSSYTSFESPKSPLFSREDQLEIHRNRRQLEMDITALEHKLKVLKSEIENVRKNVVSQGELTHLKAQTRAKISENQSSERRHLIDEYVETMRGLRAAEASIAVLEQKIKEETMRRNYILEESSSVISALDFSDLKFSSPKMNNADSNYNATSKFDLERTIHQIQETHGTVSSLENVKGYLPLQANVAKEMTRSFETECTLRSLGTASIRQEIQTNQKLLASLEAEIRKIEKDNVKEKDNFDKRKESLNNEIVSHESQLGLATDSFKQQLQQLDDEITSLKSKIADSAVLYDRIIDETKVVLTKMRNASSSSDDSDEDINEISKSEITSYYDATPSPITSLLEDESVLQARKRQLQEEIEEIKDQIREMKKKGLRKEQEMKEEITALNEKYKHNKAILLREGYQFNSSSNSSSSLSKNLEMLISKIDNSLNELKSDLQ